jgi:hypothetical protein
MAPLLCTTAQGRDCWPVQQIPKHRLQNDAKAQIMQSLPPGWARFNFIVSNGDTSHATVVIQSAVVLDWSYIDSLTHKARHCPSAWTQLEGGIQIVIHVNPNLPLDEQHTIWQGTIYVLLNQPPMQTATGRRFRQVCQRKESVHQVTWLT